MKTSAASRFSFTSTPLSGLMCVAGVRMGDNRGFFQRVFCQNELADTLGFESISQINQSHTAGPGTVRGLHFQFPPYGEKKLITCLGGKIWDIAVDLRANSSTFLHWHAQILDADTPLSMLIPEGFAHGFQVLSQEATVIYLTSSAYCPEAEGGVSPLDPLLHISWPLPPVNLSARDQAHPLLDASFKGIHV